ncbi:MAG: hypothetical protein KatS3mg028_0201 [Bacteroidia bacterium]|nr:MAG: hypothetical protein KatS3mg028_0201 [Bacteroidia bacterium]
MPEGLKEFDRLPHPIITPSTKAEQGHDVDISPKDIIDQKLATKEQYEQLEQYSLSVIQKRTGVCGYKKFDFGRYQI